MSAESPKPQGQPTAAFIATAPALESLALLDRGLGARKPFVVITGESGAGKTMLVQEALRRWSERVCARSLPAAEVTVDTLHSALLGRFGGTSNSHASAAALLLRLTDAIAHATTGNKVAMIVVDDAHLAPADVLLELQCLAELVGRKQCAVEVLLVGAPELQNRLADPRLAAVAEAVGANVRLSALTQPDTRHYVLQRAGSNGAATQGMFSRKACRDIHAATFGIPRAIEALADESAKRAARASATIISPEHVRAAQQALRARRASPQQAIGMPRAERALHAPPKPVEAVALPAEAAKPAYAEPAKPAATKPAPAKPAPAKPAVASPQPVAPEPAPVTASAAAPSAATPAPSSNDPRVKDWVSRFGGSGQIRIGASPPMPRYEASATLDVPAPAPKPVMSNRRLIVDQEPQFPAELVAKINKLSNKKRRRGPSKTVQGAALAVAAMALVVVLARQAGFGKPMGLEAADTSARAVPPPIAVAPPLALGSESPPPASEPRTSSRKKKSEKASKSKSSPLAARVLDPPPTPKPAPQPALPPIPYRLASTSPLGSSVPVGGGEQSSAISSNAHQRFGVIAGTFDTSDMAKAEKDHLARLTSYRVWVSKSRVNGARTYKLMVGRFDSMESAWSAAQTMIRHGLIRDANVTPLSAKESR